MRSEATATARARLGLRVRGTVQGVGFRPAVYRVAQRLALAGLVRNDAEGVWIEIEGDAASVFAFAGALAAAAPPLARIDELRTFPLAVQDSARFEILASTRDAPVAARIPPDLAPCSECLRELEDRHDRRYGYPFTSCTACGPRYSIIRRLPYDRALTTMVGFALCPPCRAEYEDPAHRRFHAEPTACPACGPTLSLLVRGQPSGEGEEALARAVQLLQEGAIVAVRGVGGFLLAADARNAGTIATLRARKRRPHKPFALMARDLDVAGEIAIVDDAARSALAGAARPIVLVPARAGAGLPAAIAPGLRQLGLMLPSTPLHHLLLSRGPALQIMTSGNRADEPLARDNEEALARLGGIADAFLVHDRPIHTRIDDSVVRIVAGAVQPVRRARGFAPQAIALPFAESGVLAVGAEQKSTVCLTRGGEAFVSQHLGDLTHPLALGLFEETIGKLRELCDATPRTVAHDLHPDYRSTRWALACGLPREAVQHHHAHVAACLAEHGHFEPALGVAFDGTGCGPAGELWGGEFLLADLAGFRRLGHVRALPLAGGEAAIRQPWRLAVAALVDAGEDLALLRRRPARELDAIAALAAHPATARASSVGRWFDAVAALCALRDEISYDAQAAIELEAIAADGAADPYPYALERGEPFSIDLRPMVRAIVSELIAKTPAAQVAARFHETMARVVAEACVVSRERCAGPSTAALSGGCFQNGRLTARAVALLRAAGFRVLVHREVPPNDGGVSLGQAAIAAFRRARGRRELDVPRNPR